MPRHASDDGPPPRRRRPLLLTGVAAVVAGTLVAAGLGMALPGGLAGLVPWETSGSRPAAADPSAGSPTPTPTPTPTPSPARFSLLAAGDLLPHEPVVASAADGGRTDFSPLLAGIDPWVRGADLALCHLEVPVAPRGTAPSGYPLFGAPSELVRDLGEQGWDGCSTASNHAVDRGYDGVRATLRHLDAAGMGHVGTARSEAEQDAPQLYELRRADRRITVAHLAATYGLNGLPVPAEAPWAVDLIDADALAAAARAARADGADVVVVSLHAGVEYTEDLTDQQTDVVRRLARSRQVDLVIGHHAHVPQQIARVGKGPDKQGMWTAFGLGNLLSNQSADCCDARTNNGLLLSATVTQKAPGSRARVTALEWTASTVDIAAGHRVHTLPDLLDDPSGSTLSGDELEARADRVRAAVGDAAPERTAPHETTGPAPDVVPRTDD
ncbi:CapA family protein [Isoptericola cucumis]|uniref:CapA family protein n=1 Tax=Isoptericola cucumis TaxID=1776856 RepID=UPI001E2AA0A7|nr:CapA family protein [Isoptericola cucumis]